MSPAELAAIQRSQVIIRQGTARMRTRAFYEPFCPLCRQNVYPDKSTEYRLIAHAPNSSDISNLVPHWSPTDLAYISPLAQLMYGRVEVAGYAASQVCIARPGNRVHLVHLVHSQCKAVIESAFPAVKMGKIPIVAVLETMIPSTALETMAGSHTEGVFSFRGRGSVPEVSHRQRYARIHSPEVAKLEGLGSPSASSI